MERKIGEIFELGGNWYQCIVGNDCENCAFYERKCYNFTDNNGNNPIGNCGSDDRKDNKEVIFRKLEKVGEPYEFGKVLMQEYIIYTYPIMPYNFGHDYIRNRYNKTISIEIKQNKEDMEEKKLKLKSFDLEAAKSGKPVCTRDGRKARIICFDRKFHHDGYNYPIVAMVNNNDNELVHAYTQDGLLIENAEHELDLMMLPEKKEGWVNVYKDGDNNYRSTIYTNEKVALSRKGSACITTIKIEWEE